MARIIGGQGCDRTNDFVLSLLHIRAAFLLVRWRICRSVPDCGDGLNRFAHSTRELSTGFRKDGAPAREAACFWGAITAVAR